MCGWNPRSRKARNLGHPATGEPAVLFDACLNGALPIMECTECATVSGYFLCLLPAGSSSPFGLTSAARLVPTRKAYQQPLKPPKVLLMPTMALSIAVAP